MTKSVSRTTIVPNVPFRVFCLKYPTSFGQVFSKKFQNFKKSEKNLWKFVYISFQFDEFFDKKLQNSNFAQVWDFH